MDSTFVRALVLSLAAVVLLAGVTVAQETRQHYIVVNPADFGAPGSPTGWALGIEHGWNLVSGSWVHANIPTAELALGAAIPPLGFRSLHLNNPYSIGDTAYPPSYLMNKVYVGLNDFSGVSLSDIVTLKYSTYLQYRDYAASQTFVGQPPQLELITDSGTTTQQRTFYYKPWGMQGNNNVQERTWQEWDCTASGGVWVLGQYGGSNVTGDWTWLVNRYGGGTAKLQTPLVGDYSTPLSPAPYQLSNQSGTSLSIKIGSGHALYNNNYPQELYGKAWWPECSGINAYVDKVVVGIRQPDGSVDEYTYDFDDPAMTPLKSPVAMSNRAAAEPVVTSQCGVRPIVIYGKVGNGVGDYHAGLYFHVYDGSMNADGSPSWVRIYSPGNTVPANDPEQFYVPYVIAKGRLDNTGATKVLHCRPEDITVINIFGM